MSLPSTNGGGAADMSRVIKMLYDKLGEIENEPELVLDVLFMDKIFVEFRNQLPPFASIGICCSRRNK
jgi:hypothetical protein